MNLFKEIKNLEKKDKTSLKAGNMFIICFQLNRDRLNL